MESHLSFNEAWDPLQFAIITILSLTFIFLSYLLPRYEGNVLSPVNSPDIRPAFRKQPCVGNVELEYSRGITSQDEIELVLR